MEISRNNNTSFGLFYNLMTAKHNEFMRPVIGRLAKIGKYADITAQTTFAPVKSGSDYTIFSECIELSARHRDRFNPTTITKRIFPQQYHEKLATPSQIKAGQEAAVRAAYEAAKEAIMSTHIAEKQLKNSYYDKVERLWKPIHKKLDTRA